MIPFLDLIATAVHEFASRFCQAFDEKRTGFSDYEAGDFLAAGGRMECDGPDAAACTCPVWILPSDPHLTGCPADPFSAAGVAAEPRSAPVEPAPQAPGADPWSEPEVLLRETASYLDKLTPAGHRAFADPLIAALRDLAAAFDADANPLTSSPEHGE